MSSSPIADISTIDANEQHSSEPRSSGPPLLVCLPFLNAEDLQAMRDRLASALPGRAVLIATPQAVSESDASGDVRMIAYPATSHTPAGWALTASDYLAASQLALEHHAEATLVLGAKAASLSTAALQGLIAAILSGKADLALPHYTAGPHDALVSSALLYPLTHALFGGEARLPLPLDAAFSARMAGRFAVAARKPNISAANEPLLWPVAEAALALCVVREVEAGGRTLPQPSNADLNSLLAEVVGSLFSDIEVKATFWQRARPATVAKRATEPAGPAAREEDLDDVRAMAESFRNAYANLQEIWSLVLPPQSLLGLKRVSRAPAEDFEMPADLWARTVYDFVLAYHLRTINRGHLLGALTPLYLAWVGSHLRRSAGDATLAAYHVEETAAAFVTEKPYIVARWRWPDRFNP